MPTIFEWRETFEEADELTATDRHILWSVSRYMDKHGGGAFPSLTTLTRRTARSRGTVTESLAWAEKAGWLNVTRGCRPGTKEKAPNVYTATVPAAAIRKTKAGRAAWSTRRKEANRASGRGSHARPTGRSYADTNVGSEQDLELSPNSSTDHTNGNSPHQVGRNENLPPNVHQFVPPMAVDEDPVFDDNEKTF